MKNFKVIVYFILVIIMEAFSINDRFEAKQRVKRVVEGIQVSESDYTFMLSLKYTKDSKHFCGASRLSEKWAITAAHCIFHVQPTQFYVTTTENRTILIDEIIQNDFNSINYANDIALLKLKIRHDCNASTVLLPNHLVKPHEECLILGKGAKEYGGENSELLLAGYVEVLSYDDCLSKLGHVMTPEEHTGMFCAGGKDVDACNGDSGGPILCKNSDDHYELTGIISYGMGCGTHGVPGVYTGTYHHINWINKIVF